MKKLFLTQTRELVELVAQQITTLAQEKTGNLHIAIPGGRSATFLVEAVLNLPEVIQQRLQLILVDERLSGEKNEDALYKAGLFTSFSSQVMKRTQLIVPKASRTIFSNANDLFDLIYLGIGEDGHFASLFPGSYPGKDTNQTALVVNSPKPPKERVTITYEGFRQLGATAPLYLLFLGEGKRDAYVRFLSNKESPFQLPCSFFLHEGFQVTTISDLKE